MTSSHFIGLMSGTSLDGADGVLARLDNTGHLNVLAHDFVPFDATFRSELLALNQSGPDELHRSALAGNAIARHYAEVVAALLHRTGLQPAQVSAIGAHGQTVRHRPLEFDADEAKHRPAVGYTLQLINPALLAELTGIDVVADFRSRDLAAGGQGAPLVRVCPAGTLCGCAQHWRHRQFERAQGRRLGVGLGLRSGQCPDGLLVRSPHGTSF